MRKDYFKGIELVASKDVQNILGVSNKYVWSLVKSGKLPSQKTSAGYIFPIEAVKDYQKRRLEKAKTDPRIQI